ncbi:MAG: ABC transporter permease [Oscillochloridaceae bacterium umkhey_bin13]
MLRNVFTKTLWEQRIGIVGWCLGLAVAAAVYAAFYPSIRSPEMAAALENYPQAMIEAFGLSDMISPAGYLQSTVFGIIGPILILIFAISTGTRAIAGDEHAGTLDLLLAYPVSRTKVLLHRFAALAVALSLIGVSVLLMLIALNNPAELALPVSHLAAMALQLSLLGLSFGALALAAGAITGRPTLALGIASGFGVVSYFANTLAPRVDGLAWLQKLSPFYYYSGSEPLRNGLQAGDTAVLLGLVIVFVVIGVVGFNRRDIGV